MGWTEARKGNLMALVSALLEKCDLLTFMELQDGGLDDVDKGVLNEAVKLSALLDAPLAALSFSVKKDQEFEPYGLSELVILRSEQELTDYPDAQAAGLAQAMTERKAKLLILPHTDLGATLAPSVAARLGASLFTEAIGVELSKEGLLLTRRAVGEQVAEKLLWQNEGSLVLTLAKKILSTTVAPSIKPQKPKVTYHEISVEERDLRKRIIERIPSDPQTVDVSEAEVIFCAGKGFDQESFARLQELAKLLNASLGVTRPVYDLGWAEFERMIGQTGKTVAPRLYLGIGISGSMHHIGGIRDSKCIISLNIDKKAPIIPNSDENFVGDLKEVLPLLLEKVKAHMGRGGER
jgi:electron transfer flavoprotein alpha subunit